MMVVTEINAALTSPTTGDLTPKTAIKSAGILIPGFHRPEDFLINNNPPIGAIRRLVA
jgi:hypothetical protein